MKTTSYILFTCLFIWFILIRCESESDLPENTPTVVKKTSKITVNISTDLVLFNDTVDISWTTQDIVSLEINGVKMDDWNVTINGVKQPNIYSGTITINNLKKDTTIVFSAIDKVGNAWSESYVVKVGEIPKQYKEYMDILTDGVWQQTEYRVKGLYGYEGIWYIFYPSNPDSNRVIYTKNSDYSKLLYGNSRGKKRAKYDITNDYKKLILNSTYYTNENSDLGGALAVYFDIITLNNDSLIICNPLAAWSWAGSDGTSGNGKLPTIYKYKHLKL